MIQYIVAEWRKLHKVQLGLIGLLMLGISSVIGFGIYYMNRAVFIEDTQSIVMWGQLTFYYSQIFYPALLAIFVGLCFMPEFERTTLEMLQANHVSIKKLVVSKLLNLLLLLLPIQLLLVVFWLFALWLDQITVFSELVLHLKWIFLSLIGSLGILSLQAYLFVKTRNIAKSVAYAAMGAVGGFVLLFIGDRLPLFYPYSQPMIALRSRALVDFPRSELVLFVGINLLYCAVFYGLTVRELQKRP
ncbi:ABC transporter permease [Streptococcus sp. zg-86]|uniref:ABC transporter permease n=1 Tax=Streptococcus zhangguiae TaxID=2664091 RepID=A0A6I4R7N6_9STRE|nr:ABC transporter permease [Streptococcus sp. zg-70]MTB63814.1 ABC transporter permease [Streptococcus sp. zg-86]MTB90124.1 ABC transporter permease [Streptococcus sp. zg-36]MWV55796.1 ABC transporter permease [Streptococcus sp. zg-70]